MAILKHDTHELGGLAADEGGEDGPAPAIVLLHGLTFDRTMWKPALRELRGLDPRRRTIALDLPGHGGSAPLAVHDLETVATAVQGAVEAAGVDAPVVVGHSISGVIATIYAARYPTRGVVNVDQSLQVAPFAQLVRSLRTQLEGEDFPALWRGFADGMHTELLPPAAQELVRSTSNPRQDLVLSYWTEILDRPIDEVVDHATRGLAALRTRGTPYLVVAGADLDRGSRQWLSVMLPQATVTVLPDSGHFPHLAHPAAFAECLHATRSWPVY